MEQGQETSWTSISVGISEKIVTFSKTATISNWGWAGKKAAACFSVGNSCYVSSCTLLRFCQDCSLSTPRTLHPPHLLAAALQTAARSFMSCPLFFSWFPTKQAGSDHWHTLHFSNSETPQIWSSKFIMLHPHRNANHTEHSLNISAKRLQ